MDSKEQIFKALVGDGSDPSDITKLNCIPIKADVKEPARRLFKKSKNVTDWNHIYSYGKTERDPFDPKLNLGVVLGASGGVMVVDVDFPQVFHNNVIKAMNVDLSGSYRVKSANQHCLEGENSGLFRGHIYYRFDLQLQDFLGGKSVVDFKPDFGFELKMAKGWVMAEGSSIPDKKGNMKTYTRVDGSPTDIGPCPDWVKRAVGMDIPLSAEETEMESYPDVIKYISKFHGVDIDAGLVDDSKIYIGNRDDRCFKIVSWANKADVPYEVMLETFLEPFVELTDWERSKCKEKIDRFQHGDHNTGTKPFIFKDKVVELKAEAVSTDVFSGFDFKEPMVHLEGKSLVPVVVDLIKDNVFYIVDRNMWTIWDGSVWALKTPQQMGNVLNKLVVKYVLPGVKEHTESKSAFQKTAWFKLFVVDYEFMSRKFMPVLGGEEDLSCSWTDWDNPKAILFEDGVVTFDGAVLVFGENKPEHKLIHRQKLQLSIPHGKYSWKDLHRFLHGSADGRTMAKFFSELFQTKIEEDYVLRALGYTLSGRKNEKCMFLVKGEKDAGKTALLKLLIRTLGTWCAEVEDSVIYVNRNGGSNGHQSDKHRLRGARFAVLDELTSKRAVNSKEVKYLTTCSQVTTSEKNEKPFSWVNKFTFWFFTNEPFAFNSTDAPLISRMRWISMKNAFLDPHKADSGYDARNPLHKPIVQEIEKTITDRAVWLFLFLGLARYKHVGQGSLPPTFQVESDAIVKEASDDSFGLFHTVLIPKGSKYSANSITMAALLVLFRKHYGSNPDVQRMTGRGLLSLLQSCPAFMGSMKYTKLTGDNKKYWRLYGHEFKGGIESKDVELTPEGIVEDKHNDF